MATLRLLRYSVGVPHCFLVLQASAVDTTVETKKTKTKTRPTTNLCATPFKNSWGGGGGWGGVEKKTVFGNTSRKLTWISEEFPWMYELPLKSSIRPLSISTSPSAKGLREEEGGGLQTRVRAEFTPWKRRQFIAETNWRWH